MFEIVARLFNGTVLTGYEVSDGSKKNKQITLEQAQGLAMAGGIKDVEYNSRTDRLTGTKNLDLRSIPKKQKKAARVNIHDAGVFTGERLKILVENSIHGYRERKLIHELMEFLNQNCNGKICALYGLRRTGKTTMMHHAIHRLMQEQNAGNQTAYLTLTEKDSFASLYQELDRLVNSGYRYIFIDEITALNGFIQSSALLADQYGKMGIHIIIAGTDSYVLELAGQNNLFNRMTRINTTYIGYKEYNYLCPGTTVLDYIHNGGVLPVDIFYDAASTRRYISTAISQNIINSLIRADNRKEHAHLLELNSRGLLKKAIEQAIESANEQLTTYVITNTYVNHALGSAKQLMAQVFDLDDTLDTDEIEDKVRYALSIVKQFDAEISEDYISELKTFLLELNLMKQYDRYVNGRKIQVEIFVQPGLRYHQTIELLRALQDSSSFYEIPKRIRDEFSRKILEDVEGNLLEHEIILSNLVKYQDTDVEVTQINYKGKEIDMVCHEGNKADIYEIKRSSQISEGQYKWLVNQDFNAYIEEFFGCQIERRCVLYLGENARVEADGMMVEYVNINQFLIE